jgi:hypothetical protein
MFGNAFQFLTSLWLLAAMVVMIDPRAAEWAAARIAETRDGAAVAAELPAPGPAPEPVLRPEPAAFRASAGALGAAEACVAVWLAVDGVGSVTPHGGRPLGGGAEGAAEKDVYGCVGVSDAAGPVFVVARALRRDVWTPAAWRVEALCDNAGRAIGGASSGLCAHSPL